MKKIIIKNSIMAIGILFFCVSFIGWKCNNTEDSGSNDDLPNGTTILAPVSPGDLTATPASSSEISLSWTDNSDNETGFRIERAPDEGGRPGVYEIIHTALPDENSFNDTGLEVDTTYHYRVCAFNDAGDSLPAEVSATTQGNASIVPDAPSDLIATPASSIEIALSWTDNSDNETGFRIERAPDIEGNPDNFDQIAIVLTDITSYIDIGLASDTTYHYRVIAYNDMGNSDYSNEDSATTQLQQETGNMIIDHTCTDITQIPESAILQAKASLHIGYGHTSHGSQLTTGMSGLVNFANSGGLGLSLPDDIFAWNNGGTGGALDLEEGDGYGTDWLDHDGGYYPNWINETEDYLNDPSHFDVNVIIWSWCGQASGRTEQSMIDMYLDPMSQLEEDYPNVAFVYMTGHADGSGEVGNLHLRNQQIREYCIANDKVLYDYYDIECYNPDGVYFGAQWVEDDCDYFSTTTEGNKGALAGNWAVEWQNSHTQNVDWYSCGSSHSKPLNANRKAYAAWWLWAKLSGWDGS